MSKDKKLSYYSTRSKLMEISISYGNENFTFNLNEELVIDENKINQEAQMQPSSYAFLNMLYKKLMRSSEAAENRLDKKYSELFIKFKGERDQDSGRQIANETVKAKILTQPSYISLQEKFLEISHQAMILEVCVKSFEQRVNLIQTLSANLRKG